MAGFGRGNAIPGADRSVGRRHPCGDGGDSRLPGHSRNLLGGHLLAAVVGVVAFKFLGGQVWLAEAGAVATAIALMHLTRTLHPPGGATALLPVIGGEQIQHLGFLFVLVPVALGVLILLVAAVVFNNIPRTRRYPEAWF